MQSIGAQQWHHRRDFYLQHAKQQMLARLLTLLFGLAVLAEALDWPLLAQPVYLSATEPGVTAAIVFLAYQIAGIGWVNTQRMFVLGGAQGSYCASLPIADTALRLVDYKTIVLANNLFLLPFILCLLLSQLQAPALPWWLLGLRCCLMLVALLIPQQLWLRGRRKLATGAVLIFALLLALPHSWLLLALPLQLSTLVIALVYMQAHAPCRDQPLHSSAVRNAAHFQLSLQLQCLILWRRYRVSLLISAIYIALLASFVVATVVLGQQQTRSNGYLIFYCGASCPIIASHFKTFSKAHQLANNWAASLPLGPHYFRLRDYGFCAGCYLLSTLVMSSLLWWLSANTPPLWALASGLLPLLFMQMIYRTIYRQAAWCNCVLAVLWMYLLYHMEYAT